VLQSDLVLLSYSDDYKLLLIYANYCAINSHHSITFEM